MKAVKLLSLLFFFPFLFVSCHQKVKEQKQDNFGPFANYTQTLTKADTVDVMSKVTQFMDYVKNGSFQSAAALLYKPDANDVWNEPILLDNDELGKVADFLKQMSFDSYSIDYIKFHSPIDTDIRCTLLNEKDGHIQRKLHFKPINYLGGWRLCLMN